MAFPTNPYKNLPGDGIHIPEDLIQNVGEIPQRGLNGELVAVPAGTEGQVPTYQADGTLAPADASGGGGGGSADSTNCFYHDFVFTGLGAGDDVTLSFDVARTGVDPDWVTALTSTAATLSAGLYSVDWITGYDYASSVSGVVRAWLTASTGSTNVFDQPDYQASTLPHQAALDVVLIQHQNIMSATPTVVRFHAHVGAVASVYGTVRIAKLA